jgi:diguanylate cyclase (GGDEF)-like protein
MKIAPFRLPALRSSPRRRGRDAVASLGVNDDEISPRARAKLVELIDDLERMRAEAERLAERVVELEALADTDPLANVMNRRAFMRELTKTLAFAARHGGPVSVLYIDLVGFKAINDVHGHRAGDAAIVYVAELLETHVRVTDAVGRIGGDEFALVLARAGEGQAQGKAAELREALSAAPLVYDGATLALDMSIGVYEARDGDTADGALAAADEAMYADKSAGREETGRENAGAKKAAGGRLVAS